MRIPYTQEMPYGGQRTYGGEPTLGVLCKGRYQFMYRGKNYRVHRLICEAFAGPAPFSGPGYVCNTLAFSIFLLEELRNGGAAVVAISLMNKSAPFVYPARHHAPWMGASVSQPSSKQAMDALI